MTVVMSDNLKRALMSVSQDIAADLHDALDELSDDEDEAMIVAEACMDANRLSTLANNFAAEAEVSGLIAKHGYPAVLEEAAKHVAVW